MLKAKECSWHGMFGALAGAMGRCVALTRQRFLRYRVLQSYVFSRSEAAAAAFTAAWMALVSSAGGSRHEAQHQPW